MPRTPKIYFNEYMIYEFSNGFGIGLGPQVTGPRKAKVSRTLTIPAQVTWNAEVFYRRPNWEVQVNFLNFTDPHNFTVIDPTFTGNDVFSNRCRFTFL